MIKNKWKWKGHTKRSSGKTEEEKQFKKKNHNSDVKNVITDMKKGLDLYMVLSD